MEQSVQMNVLHPSKLSLSGTGKRLPLGAMEYNAAYGLHSLFKLLSQHTPYKNFITPYTPYGASLVAQMVKNLPAMQETQVWSLSWDDPLEKGMATHSSILAWRIPWTEGPGKQQSMGLQRVRHDWATNTHTPYIFWSYYFIMCCQEYNS